MNELRSSLDTHTYEPEILKNSSCTASNTGSSMPVSQSAIVCKSPCKATKIKDLASNLLNQDCPFTKYTSVKDAAVANQQVVDLVISGLPSEAQPEDLKKISGAKHVVEATVDQDAIRNVCTGTGKIKVRLGESEDLEQVKLEFLKVGLDVYDSK